MIDFHAHILPCADHGSQNIETSIKEVKRAVRAGIDTIIATPHFYKNKDNLSDFIKRRDESYDALIAALADYDIYMNIIKASEVTLQVDLFELDNLRPLCIEGTNYMLLEMPLNVNWTQWHYNAIDELIARGIEPIIAHINRYPSYYLKKLFEKDILFQVNVEAFEKFSSRARTLNYFNKGYVDLIGSDVHSFSMSSYESFKKYSEKYPKIFKTSDGNAIRILKTRKSTN